MGCLILDRDPGSFETLAPTTSTGISSALLKPARVTGAATAADTTTVTLASGSSTVDGYYTGWDIYLYGAAAGANQKRTITDYVGSTLVATVGKMDDPTNTVPYALVPKFEGMEAQEALVTVETYQVRFRIDGIAPTASVGHLLAAGESYLVKGAVALKNLRFIDTASGASSVKITVFF